MSIAKDLRKLLDEQKQQDDLDTQIQSLLEQVKTGDLATASADDLKKMRDQLLKTQKLINPYGRTISGKERLLCGSFTVIRDEYQMRLTLTTIIGFLFRAIDEWKVPENVPAVNVYDYMKNPDVLKPPPMAGGKPQDPALVNAYEESRAWMEKRMTVLQFLEDTLLFNPDEHVRSAYMPNPDDPERSPIGTAAGQLAVYHRRCELQAKKKQDLKALYRADMMVDYVDKVLFAVPEEDYRLKLTDLKKQVLTDLEKYRDEIHVLSTRTSITEHKTIISQTGEKKEINHTRALTSDDEAAGGKRLRELYVIVGQLVGNLGDIDDRMQRFDDFIAWKERKTKEDAEQAEIARAALAEREEHKQHAESLDIQAKIEYVEKLNAKFDAQRKADEERKKSIVTLGKVEVPAEPTAILAQVDTVIAAAKPSTEANINVSETELDMEAVRKTADDPAEPVLEKKERKKKEKNHVMPKAHVLPPTSDEIVADAIATVNESSSSHDPGTVDRKVAQRVRERIPPHDIYNKLQRYMDQNYEALRKAVLDLYAYKPDIETMFNPYEIFEDDPPGTNNPKTKEDKANDFVYRNRNTTIAPIITFTTNKWNLMGSFSEVRERTRFYNDETVVLEEMANQIQNDQMLGRDLMQKKKEKKRNANRELGRDGDDDGDKKFEEWRKANAPATSAMDDDPDDPNRPPDAIDVPVITIKDGGRIVEKTKFYTASETPSHVRDIPESFQVRGGSDPKK